MKFINLTLRSDDLFDYQLDVSVTINPEHIVLMKDLGEYIEYPTEVELSNGSSLMVYETIQEIMDMINDR